MAEFEDMLQSILSSPKEMEKIMGLARELSGEKNEPEREKGPAVPGLGELSPKALSAIGKILGRMDPKDDDKAALVRSMKPYLRPERREALDRAVKIARIARVARLAMDEFGGELDIGL